ncbi:MAG: hypothetical protein A2020_10970 [Lentisphaerae bacterium GWF2_45_14]|nr:MAG: hypothetical protein A2020_10970 [Lentisphaerae bacterium GWF2_45_14]
MPDKKNIIRIRNASVMLDCQPILKDINWELNEGENYFILGMNGAGKTTLVRLIMGLVWPVFGAEVSVLGNTFGRCNLTEVRKKISWVSPYLQQWTSNQWTILQVVLSGFDGTIGLYEDHSESDVEKAMKLLELLSCDSVADHPYDKISTGQQTKALIARALISNPELLILDEPYGHLDMKSREFLMGTIEKIAEKPDAPSIVFITQRIEEISPFLNKGMIMKDGRIFVNGEKKDVLGEENLENAFDLKIKLHKTQTGRYWPVVHS